MRRTWKKATEDMRQEAKEILDFKWIECRNFQDFDISANTFCGLLIYRRTNITNKTCKHTNKNAFKSYTMNT